MTEIAVPFIFHGSEDSLDIDVYFLVDQLGTLNEAKKLCDDLSHKHAVNGNLIVVKDGQVVDVYKGTVDEVNNSILATYHLHEQIHPIPVNKKVERDICLKWLRVIRGILSHCSRTEYRATVKAALRAENVADKLKAILEIDFSKIDDFGKEKAAEVHKFVCFQVAQYLGLLEGVEIYTKSQAKKYLANADVSKFLYRIPANKETLNYLVKMVAMFPPVKSQGLEYTISEDGKQIVTPFGVLITKTEKYL